MYFINFAGLDLALAPVTTIIMDSANCFFYYSLNFWNKVYNTFIKSSPLFTMGWSLASGTAIINLADFATLKN